MPRHPRARSKEHLYHVTSRGVARRAVFRTSADGRVFLSTLGEVVTDREWRCHCYCLMPNHYHLLVETPSADLPEGMRDLNSAYATRFNTAHDLTGHVFQGRYASRVVRSQEHVLEVARYIPLNPVRAGLCRGPADWAWSSYRATAGLDRPAPWLTTGTTLRWFGTGDDARRRYCEFVAAGHGVADPEAAAVRTLLCDGGVDDVLRVRDQYGYSMRRIAALLGIHHSTLAERIRPRHPPKGV
jgi:REP element-mobilizing transposase RayT